MRTIPAPPAWLRRGPLREGAFRSRLHDERTASLIGVALGTTFATAFLTGLLSHYLQHPPSWLDFPSRPVWGYRFTQGLHVVSGIASIPLLLAKLWTVYPRLFGWPPLKSIAHGLERLSIFVLISGAVFELVTGLLNTIQWYPWRFPFTITHYWVAWITVGALVLHIAVKAPAINRGLRKPAPEIKPAAEGEVSRRAFLTATGIAVGAVTITTVGQSVSSLRALDVLAPRDPSVGPQHVPINRSAEDAGVLRSAVDPNWTLVVDGPSPFQLSLAQLTALTQHASKLPIACVEGWSVDAHWEGVRIRDLLDRVGAPHHATLRVFSLEKAGAYRVMDMGPEYARDPLTLLALKVNGERLDVEHGFPARIIAPNRPGVLQTKWVSRLEVL